MTQQNNANNNTNSNATEEKKSNFVNTRCGSYFSDDSCLILGYSSDGYGRTFATVQFAPRFPETRGRAPRKGEKIYDYDNIIFVGINSSDLEDFLDMVKKMVVNKEIGEVGIRTGGEGNEKNLRLIRTSSLEGYKGEGPSNEFILYVESSVGNAQFNAQFPFSCKELTYYKDLTAVKEGEADSIVEKTNTMLKVFVRWLNRMAEVLQTPLDYIPIRQAVNYRNAREQRKPMGNSNGRVVTRRGAPNQQNGGGQAPAQQQAETSYEAGWGGTADDGDLPF
jgi:DNA-binding Lrp family transcriptional regulator